MLVLFASGVYPPNELSKESSKGGSVALDAQVADGSRICDPGSLSPY